MSKRLDGKVAIITGGASGMGRATVRKFVNEGARVLVADMQVQKGRDLVAELGDATVFQETDVCDEASVKRMVDTAVGHFGRLDCLFNNAGFGGVNGDIETTNMGEPYARTVDAMLKGVIMGMKYAAPVMKAQKSGVILSTASVAGLMAGYGPHVYTAIKSAVINLTRSVAQELGPHNIRVNAICPGGIATPIFAGQLALKGNEDYAALVKPMLTMMQPIPRAGEPEDIANAACFLASDEASFVSGHALVVDGALTAGGWTHPSIGAGAIDALAQAFGVKDASELDMVYHAGG
ncbi:MAG: glucose 1-dehydrogenase [Pseudomonadales bacterium]|nr:glucose 1-dehydrogenase [Pseudomonadales bacterium]MCP5185112.1 glucose 1-dehydrogenase [Pseudomonadales bacterium]